MCEHISNKSVKLCWFVFFKGTILIIHKNNSTSQNQNKAGKEGRSMQTLIPVFTVNELAIATHFDTLTVIP